MDRVVIRCLVALLMVACGADVGGSQTPPATPEDHASVGPSAAPGLTAWEHLGEIAYVLPDDLPSGWTVRLANERAGRPHSEWEDHIEILATADRDAYLIVGVHGLSAFEFDPGVPTGQPGRVRDIDPSRFTYLFGFVVGPDDASRGGTAG